MPTGHRKTRTSATALMESCSAVPHCTEISRTMKRTELSGPLLYCDTVVQTSEVRVMSDGSHMQQGHKPEVCIPGSVPYLFTHPCRKDGAAHARHKRENHKCRNRQALRYQLHLLLCF